MARNSSGLPAPSYVRPQPSFVAKQIIITCLSLKSSLFTIPKSPSASPEAKFCRNQTRRAVSVVSTFSVPLHVTMMKFYLVSIDSSSLVPASCGSFTKTPAEILPVSHKVALQAFSFVSSSLNRPTMAQFPSHTPGHILFCIEHLFDHQKVKMGGRLI